MCNIGEGIAQEYMEEGRAEGIAEGTVKGMDTLGKLISLLLKDNRLADVQAASTDRESRQRLIEEYGLA